MSWNRMNEHASHSQSGWLAEGNYLESFVMQNDSSVSPSGTASNSWLLIETMSHNLCKLEDDEFEEESN